MAINLESRVVELAEKILVIRKRDTGSPVSALIRKATHRLNTSKGLGGDTREAVDWLAEAGGLVQRRNEILHSRYVVAYSNPFDQQNGRPLLLHYPDPSTGDGKPVGVLVDISAGYLTSVAVEIESTLARWSDVDSLVSAIRWG